MTKIHFVLLAVGALVLTAGCSRAVKDDAHTHSHDESLQLTAYNELFEVYAEVTPPVAGDSCEVVAHFTRLKDFKPLEAGSVTATLGTSSQKLDTPTRTGIYKFKLASPAEGEAAFTFDITTPDGTSLEKLAGHTTRIVTPAVTVYVDEHEAQHHAFGQRHRYGHRLRHWFRFDGWQRRIDGRRRGGLIARRSGGDCDFPSACRKTKKKSETSIGASLVF